MGKGKSKAAYMISAVAEQYQIHPQTLRLYEREGLLKPSRSEGNTRLYTDDDLERLEVILQADARSGRQSGRRRDHPEHAREDGRDAGRSRNSCESGTRGARAEFGGRAQAFLDSRGPDGFFDTPRGGDSAA
jgi:hypothetical protein